jgi:hypothetical protein
MIGCDVVIQLVISQRLGLASLVGLLQKKRRVRWRVLVVVRSLVLGMVNLYGW